MFHAEGKENKDVDDYGDACLLVLLEPIMLQKHNGGMVHTLNKISMLYCVTCGMLGCHSWRVDVVK